MTTLPADPCSCHHLRFNHAGDGSDEGGTCLIGGCTCHRFHDELLDRYPDEVFDGAWPHGPWPPGPGSRGPNVEQESQ